MRRKLTGKRDVDTMGAHILSPPWKLEPLQGLPELELRSWYDNMEAGLDVARDDLHLYYKVGNVMFSFKLTPRRLVLPDGSIKVLRIADGSGGDSSEQVNPVDQIARHLLGKVKDPDVMTFEFTGVGRDDLVIQGPGEPDAANSGKSNVITYGQLLTDLINGQFEAIERNGVERAGFFVEGFKALHHMENPCTDHIVFADINKYSLLPNGRRVPNMIVQVNVNAIDTEKIHCLYHTHWPLKENRPSQFDLELIVDRGEDSIIIAGRREDRSVQKGSYLVTEWRPKTNVDLARALKGCRSLDPDSVDRYDRDGIARLIDEKLEKKDYLLAEEAAKMVFKPL